MNNHVYFKANGTMYIPAINSREYMTMKKRSPKQRPVHSLGENNCAAVNM
jgi:hypothetical protein